MIANRKIIPDAVLANTSFRFVIATSFWDKSLQATYTPISVLNTATKCIRGCCNEAPEAIATRIIAFKREMALAILMPSKKNDA